MRLLVGSFCPHGRNLRRRNGSRCVAPSTSYVTQDVRDLFILQVIQLLFDRERSSLIRQCLQCEKFFLRTRRQLYCSAACVDKANKAAWLKTPKGKRYLKKLKGKKGGRK